MTIRPPAGYLTLPTAREQLRQCMFRGIKGDACEYEGNTVGDVRQNEAAAESLRAAILACKLELFVTLKAAGQPTRLDDQRLIEAALFPKTSTVLTFKYLRPTAPALFGLSGEEFKRLIRDPLFLEERAFRIWLKKEARKRAWPCHGARHVAPGPGRPPEKRDLVEALIKRLGSQGEITPTMTTKEVCVVLHKVQPSLDVSPNTVRRAREIAGY